MATITAPAAAAPLVATVNPNTGLEDGDTVTVSWSGTTPGSTINIIQCSGAGGAQYCDMPRGKLSIANPTGDGSTTFVVHTGAIGTGQCDAGHNQCILFVNQDLSFDADKNAFPTLSFGAAAAPATTTTTAAATTSSTAAPATTPTTAAAAVQSASTTQGAELARTGSAQTGWLAAVGVLAVGTGGVLVRRSRRRPQES